MLRSVDKQSGESVESVLEKKRKATVGREMITTNVHSARILSGWVGSTTLTRSFNNLTIVSCN